MLQLMFSITLKGHKQKVLSSRFLSGGCCSQGSLSDLKASQMPSKNPVSDIMPAQSYSTAYRFMDAMNLSGLSCPGRASTSTLRAAEFSAMHYRRLPLEEVRRLYQCCLREGLMPMLRVESMATRCKRLLPREKRILCQCCLRRGLML